MEEPSKTIKIEPNVSETKADIGEFSQVPIIEKKTSISDILQSKNTSKPGKNSSIDVLKGIRTERENIEAKNPIKNVKKRPKTKSTQENGSILKAADLTYLQEKKVADEALCEKEEEITYITPSYQIKPEQLETLKLLKSLQKISPKEQEEYTQEIQKTQSPMSKMMSILNPEHLNSLQSLKSLQIVAEDDETSELFDFQVISKENDKNIGDLLFTCQFENNIFFSLFSRKERNLS